jgi:hypothetical protein
MKREFLAITADLARELVAADGWERVDTTHHETRDLIHWRRTDGKTSHTNVPKEFPEPMQQAVRMRMVATLTRECPRCGQRGVPRDPNGLTESELDCAQVDTTHVTVPLGGLAEDGSLVKSGVVHLGDPGYVVLLHDRKCEAAPVNLDVLGRARWS